MNVLNGLFAKLRATKCADKSLSEVAGLLGLSPSALLKLEKGETWCPKEAVKDKAITVFELQPDEEAILNLVWKRLNDGQLGNGEVAILRDSPYHQMHLFDARPFRLTCMMQMNVTVIFQELQKGQEAVVFYTFIRSFCHSKMRQKAKGLIQGLRKALRAHPQRVFLHPSDGSDYNAGAFGDLTLISDMLLCSQNYLGTTVTTSQEIIDGFLEDFEKLKSESLPPDKAVSLFDETLQEFEEYFRRIDE